MKIAKTPKTPYYAVIFTSVRTTVNEGYATMADKMHELAQNQPGFLGFESARSDLGISVSYWKDLESVAAWKWQSEHRLAQQFGREKWYSSYKIRIAKVERDYEFIVG
jgi:heme-degrading monooxygenase HmoA